MPQPASQQRRPRRGDREIRRHRHLVGQLARIADAEDAHRHIGDGPFAHAEHRERRRRRHRCPRSRAREPRGSPARRRRSAPTGRTPRSTTRAAPASRPAAGVRAAPCTLPAFAVVVVIMIALLADARERAVVHDDAVLAQHQAVARLADRQAAQRVAIDAVEELGRVGALDVDLAQGRDVGDAGAAAHRR